MKNNTKTETKTKNQFSNKESPHSDQAMIEIYNIVTSCAPWEPNDQDYAEQRDYLVSLLSSRGDERENDVYAPVSEEDDEDLFEIVDGFFVNPEASRKLVDLWKKYTSATPKRGKPCGKTLAISPSEGTSIEQGFRIEIVESETSKTSHSDTTEGITETTIDTSNETPTLTSRKKNKSRSPKRGRRRQKKESRPKENDSHVTETQEQNLQEVVEKIHKASALELDATDDFASAWQDAQEEGRVWGGRGFGGRGINRGLGKYNGKDAVVQGLTLAFDGKELLKESHLVIAHGHRYGLWGKNGVGKSTLLRRIATGRLPGWPLHLSVAMVQQEVLASDKTVKEEVTNTATSGNDADRKECLEKELADLEERLVEVADDGADAESLEQITLLISDLYEQLEGIELKEVGHSKSIEAEEDAFEGIDNSSIEILKGLGFDDSMLDTPARELSGGWRSKVALTKALCSNPDILLLDEPTNHLDASATIFLEDYILKHNLTLVVVSHDGDFLDTICTDMIKFENQKLEYHVGNYTTFREREAQLWKSNTHIAEAAAKKEQKAMEFIQKQKSMSNSKRRDDNKQRQAKEREKKLSRIGLYNNSGKRYKLLSERKGVNSASHISGAYTNSAGFSSFHVDNSQKSFGEERQRLRFKFPSAAPLKGATGELAPLITLDECRFRYSNSNPWLLQDMTLGVSVGSRIGILGKNGSGKSTIVKLLCGELSPDPKQGALKRHQGLKIAHISQHHIEHLGAHLEKSPVEYFRTQKGGDGTTSDHQIRQFLGGFGLVGSLALQPIGNLSGGQKARLAFATVLYKPPHVLILDEPTNHLDGESLDSLAEAISGFKGAVVIVSHHRGFLAQNCQEIWTIRKDGRVVTAVIESEKNSNFHGSESTSHNGGGIPFDKLYENYKNGLRKEVLSSRRKTR